MGDGLKPILQLYEVVQAISMRLASLGAPYQTPAESAAIGGAKNHAALQAMHCVIGRGKELLPRQSGGSGDCVAAIPVRLASLGAIYQLPAEFAAIGGAKNHAALQAMHCVIGRGKGLSPRQSGESGPRNKIPLDFRG